MAKKTIRKKLAKNKKVKKISILNKQKLKKYAIIMIVGLFCLTSLAFIFIDNNQNKSFFQMAKNRILQMTANAGFSIKEVNLHGRVNANSELILNLINTKENSPIFAFDTKSSSRFIKEISWVKDVKIRRKLPNTIDIYIKEKKPVAIWQLGKNKFVIDKDGNKLTAKNLDKFSDLPHVVGKDAAKSAKYIIDTVKAEPEIYKQIQSFININNRRWDIKLKNDVKVKLPKQDVELALAILAKMQKKENILSKRIKYIDMRQQDRIILKVTKL